MMSPCALVFFFSFSIIITVLSPCMQAVVPRRSSLASPPRLPSTPPRVTNFVSSREPGERRGLQDTLKFDEKL
ncbi:hypothetical protein DFH27DRAFT_550071 [Peziza echinospora]|nr:hypothetical protein DFH27DRAFT_550071 [Peziza echinospora]